MRNRNVLMREALIGFNRFCGQSIFLGSTKAYLEILPSPILRYTLCENLQPKAFFTTCHVDYQSCEETVMRLPAALAETALRIVCN